MTTLILVRHGRSAHVQTGLLDREGFLRWRAAYEAAGIDDREPPPAELQVLAAGSAVLVASTAPRAIHSAELLDPAREPVASPLLRELDLHPPNIHGIRMPMFVWALAYGVAMLFRPHVSAAELQRARDAASWLIDLSEKQKTVLAVTHHSFRSVLAKELVARGWSCETKRRSHHWSAWILRRGSG